MKKQNLLLFTFTSLFAAAIFVMTASITFPIPPTGGYVHLGDALIMICASLLPTPYAIIAAAIGASLSDFMLGFITFMPFTFIIKGLIALCFTSKNAKIINKHNLIALISVFILTIGGYYLAESIIYSNFISPAASIVGNLIQSVASVILFLAIGSLLDKLNIKKYINFNKK